MNQNEIIPSISWQRTVEPENISVNMFQFFVGFKIVGTSKYDNSENGKEDYIKNLLRQKSFIDSIKLFFFNSHSFCDYAIELRFLSNPKTRIIDIYLVVRCYTQNKFESPNKFIKEFIQILPEDISYKILDSNELSEILNLGSKSIVDIRKKSTVLPLANEVNKIHLFPSEIISLAQKESIEYDNFHLFCSDYLPYNTYNWSSFFKMLQETDGIVSLRVSISSAAISSSEKLYAIQSYKVLSDVYSRMGLQNETINNSTQNFSKFFTSNDLFSVKIQLFSNDASTALLLGSAFCTQFSYGRTKTYLEAIPIPNDVFECSKEKVRYEWENCHHYYYEPYYFNIDDGHDDQIAYNFIKKLPYIFAEEEVATIFKFPIADEEGLPGIYTKPTIPFYQPSSKKSFKNILKLGSILTKQNDDLNKKRSLDYEIPIEDLTKHGLIVGSTGSGKTNTTLNFVKELTEHGIPFLLIEPVKSEYYDELLPYFQSGKLNRFNFKKPFSDDGTCNPQYLRFNPLISMEGISVIQHISYIKGCFNAAFPMHGIMPLVFEECLYKLYLKNCDDIEKNMFNASLSPKYLHHINKSSMDEETRNTVDFLTIDFLKRTTDEYLNNKDLFSDEERKDFGSYLKRRIEKLTKGVLGNAFCPELWVNSNNDAALIKNNILKMLTEPTVVELEDLGDNDEKALVMAFIMTYLFEYRQTKPSIKSIELKEKDNFNIYNHIHITVIEEAHRLLSSGNVNSVGGGEDGIVTQDSKSKSISLFVDMLAEIRAKGEGIFIVEQIPTKLISDVIKNTNLKIMHRITSKDDRQYLGEAMNMNEQQKNYVNNLKTGEAIIFEEQLDNPVFVKMNRFI